MTLAKKQFAEILSGATQLYRALVQNAQSVTTKTIGVFLRGLRSPYVGHLRKAVPVVLFTSLATLVVQHFGWLDRFEMAGLDVFNILQRRHDPTHIVIVGITDEDYESLFGGRSPLEPQTVERLVNGIANGKPTIIGVDVDTSDKSFDELRPQEKWPPVVWAEDDLERNRAALAGRSFKAGRNSVGVALVPEDSDGVVRRYTREFESGNDRIPSFPWALLKACVDAQAQACLKIRQGKLGETDNKLMLNFSGERYDFAFISAGSLLKISEGAGWKGNSPLRDRIALLGGLYRAGRDTHVTPIGQMSGVQLTAQVLESEIGGGGIRPINEFLAVILEMACGFFLVSLHYRLGHSSVPLIGIILASFSIFCFSSYIAFSTLARWLNFAPMFFAVMIHEIHHQGTVHQKLLRENAELRTELENLKKAN